MYTIFTKVLFVFFLSTLFCCKIILAQDQEENAILNSIAEYDLKIELTDEYEVFLVEKRKIKILNEEGLDHASLYLRYDELNSIESFEGRINDPNTGKTLKKLKLKDFQDVSMISSGTVFDDSRMKYYKLNYVKFPLEITYDYTTKRKGNLSFPMFWLDGYKNQWIEKSNFTLIFPEELGLRYKVQNIDQEGKTETSDGITTVSWSFKDRLSVDDEFKDIDSLSLIKVAPKAFSMEGYSSNLETWNGLGEWIQKVNLDRDNLSVEAKAKVAELTQGIGTDLEKIRALYQYLQDNYRYVSIQLGIGGLQPMAATEVFEKKYGDCKALSMFMHAMLKEAGIKSHYTLVKAGREKEKIEVDFPSNQFNHVILQVPMENDTLWLECTSRTLPAGFLGDFTMDRHVLVVNDEGGTLMKTPAYRSAEFNQVKNISKIELLGQGMAKIQQTKELTGLAAQDYISAQYHLNEKDLQKHLYNDLDFSGAHIEQFDLSVDKKVMIPKAILNHETFLQNFYQSTSKRVIITPKYQTIHSSDLRNHYMRWEENIEILSPEEMELESGVADLDLSEDYFDYKKQQVFEDNQLKIARAVEFHFPDDVTDDDIVETIKQVKKLDEQPIFLRK